MEVREPDGSETKLGKLKRHVEVVSSTAGKAVTAISRRIGRKIEGVFSVVQREVIHPAVKVVHRVSGYTGDAAGVAGEAIESGTDITGKAIETVPSSTGGAITTISSWVGDHIRNMVP